MQDIQPEELTAALRPVAEVIGMEATAKLVCAFGGRKVYIPSVPNDQWELVQVIGIEATGRLLNKLGRRQIEVPSLYAARLLRRNKEIRLRRAAGDSASTLAQEFGLSVRQVLAILASKQRASYR